MEQFDRITHIAGVMGGKATIRGMRLTVSTLIGQIARGRSFDDILADYPYLEREDITAALEYAAWRASEREIEIATSARKSLLI